MSDHRERWRILAAEYKVARKVAQDALTAIKRSYGSVEDGTYGNPTDVQLRIWEEARSNLEAARERVEAYLAEDCMEEITRHNRNQRRYRLGLTRPLR